MLPLKVITQRLKLLEFLLEVWLIKIFWLVANIYAQTHSFTCNSKYK